jgi:hypothetical protein
VGQYASIVPDVVCCATPWKIIYGCWKSVHYAMKTLSLSSRSGCVRVVSSVTTDGVDQNGDDSIRLTDGCLEERTSAEPKSLNNPILGNGAKAPHVTVSRARYGQVTIYSTFLFLTSTASIQSGLGKLGSSGRSM